MENEKKSGKTIDVLSTQLILLIENNALLKTILDVLIETNALDKEEIMEKVAQNHVDIRTFAESSE